MGRHASAHCNKSVPSILVSLVSRVFSMHHGIKHGLRRSRRGGVLGEGACFKENQVNVGSVNIYLYLFRGEEGMITQFSHFFV